VATAGRTKDACSYTDYKVGVTKDVSGYVFGLAYVSTNAKGGVGQCYRSSMPLNQDLGKGTAVLSVVKSF
jgi:hypothetical protein